MIKTLYYNRLENAPPLNSTGSLSTVYSHSLSNTKMLAKYSLIRPYVFMRGCLQLGRIDESSPLLHIFNHIPLPVIHRFFDAGPRRHNLSVFYSSSKHSQTQCSCSGPKEVTMKENRRHARSLYTRLKNVPCLLPHPALNQVRVPMPFYRAAWNATRS